MRDGVLLIVDLIADARSFMDFLPHSADAFETCQLIQLGVFVGLRYTSAAARLVEVGETPDGNLGEEREPFRNVRIASHDRGD
jgi:hypothetical protein